MVEKRGRKRKNDLYFGPEEEMAVIEFLAAEDMNEKNKIYNDWLAAPIKKMVESIIRRYKLYRKGFTFEELRDDTISYLIWKSEKFDHTTGNRAFSYYGTICKHYILGLLQKDDKSNLKTSSFEDSFSSIEERDDLIYYLSDDEYSQDDLIKDISNQIKGELEKDLTMNPKDKKKMSQNERKVGEALINLLDNWEKIFEEMEGGSKYNKNIVLATIRNFTNLTTKDIRGSILRFKSLYFLFKESRIDDGYL